jgi:hypothetical protein
MVVKPRVAYTPATIPVPPYTPVAASAYTAHVSAPAPAVTNNVPTPTPAPAVTKMQQLGKELDRAVDDPKHSTHIDRLNEKLQDALNEDDENNAELTRRFEKTVEDSKDGDRDN